MSFPLENVILLTIIFGCMGVQAYLAHKYPPRKRFPWSKPRTPK